MDSLNVALKRPLDRPRARIRFFLVLLAANVINVFTGAVCFLTVWWFRDWAYWQTGVRTMRWYLLFAGIRTRVSGIQKLKPDRPAVYVSNHLSHFDIPAAMAGLPVRFHFIAKKELLRIPIFGWALPPLGMLMIDRSTPEKAYASINEAARRVSEENQSVLIYPEGGISKTGRLQSFKKGAFVLALSARVPIVPILVHGSDRLFSVPRIESRPGRMSIDVLDEIDTSAYGPEDVEQLMEKVHSVMLEAEEKAAKRP